MPSRASPTLADVPLGGRTFLERRQDRAARYRDHLLRRHEAEIRRAQIEVHYVHKADLERFYGLSRDELNARLVEFGWQAREQDGFAVTPKAQKLGAILYQEWDFRPSGRVLYHEIKFPDTIWRQLRTEGF